MTSLFFAYSMAGEEHSNTRFRSQKHATRVGSFFAWFFLKIMGLSFRRELYMVIGYVDYGDDDELL